VRDTRSGSVGYAVFDAKSSVNLGLLEQVSIPCMAMCREVNGSLILAVANPDLGLIAPDQPPPTDILSGITGRNLLRATSPKSAVRLTLEGRWDVPKQANARIVSLTNASTIVEVSCQNGLTTEITLARAGTPTAAAR
jgi:hypothetical protein